MAPGIVTGDGGAMPSKERTMKTGFEANHVPLLELPPYMAVGRTIATFPNLKSSTKWTRMFSVLSEDAMIHFKTNPAIVRVVAYPIAIAIPTMRNGVGSQEIHHVAFGLLMEDQTRKYIDVVPVAAKREFPFFDWLAGRLADEVREQFDATYQMLDERSLHIEPRMSNLRQLFGQLGSDDKAALARVKDILTDIDLPATVAEVRAAADLPEFQWTHWDGARPVGRERLVDCDRVFTALFQLAADGFVELDHEREFSDATLVKLRKKRRY